MRVVTTLGILTVLFVLTGCQQEGSFYWYEVQEPGAGDQNGVLGEKNFTTETIMFLIYSREDHFWHYLLPSSF